MGIEAVDWASAELPVLDEPAVAEWLAARGKHVVEHRGRFWAELTRAFFQPVHHLAQLSAREATRPAWWCASLRARLTASDRDAATGAFPVHLMEGIDGYGPVRLSARRRQQISQASRNVQILVLRAPGLLLDQGYPVMQQAHARNPKITLPSPEAFRRDVALMFDPPRGLVFAGVRDGRLLGFSTAFAVDSAAYHELVYIGDEGLPHNLSLCFFHALATLCARSGRIRELMHGSYVRDDSGLVEFKRRLGFAVTLLPAKVWLAPGLRPLLRRFRLEKLYRWGGASGDEPRSAGEGGRVARPAP